jgi:prolyl 4-hydroxylase
VISFIVFEKWLWWKSATVATNDKTNTAISTASHVRKDDYLTLCPPHFGYTMPVLFPRFLEYEECDYLIQLTSKKGFMRSRIGDQNKHESRKSKTCWLNRTDDVIIDSIMDRLAFLFMNSSLEPMQVVYYQTDDYFDPHYDQCLLKKPCCKKEMERYGNRPRTRTFLLYLNHPQEYIGGETIFPSLNAHYKLEKGSALLFHNLDTTEHYVHPKSLHAGNKVISGEKWIANVWIRG